MEQNSALQDFPEEGAKKIAAMAALTNVGGMNYSPDISALCERLRLCFPVDADLAADWTLLLDNTLYNGST